MTRPLVSRILPLALIAVSGAAFAQAFPSKPLRILVGFEAGGSTDITTRMIAAQMEKRLGQQVLVENRPGGSGSIAGRATVLAPPDGYTLLMASGTGFHEVFLKENPIDSSKELAAIGISTSTAQYILVRSSLPVPSIKEYIAYAKANPNKLNFGSPAPSQSLVMAIFEAKTGTTSTKVPYKGSGPVATAMLGEQVDVTASLLGPFLPAVQSGKIKLLVATRRSATFPDVPTGQDIGLSGWDISSNIGLWTARQTPDAIIRNLSTANAAAVQAPDVVAQLRKQDSAPVGSTPEEQMQAFEREIVFWREALKLTGGKM
jgi:tripartite-type tricarboxylate transporter receptor subunit TctC